MTVRTDRCRNKCEEKSNQTSTRGKQWVKSRNYKTRLKILEGKDVKAVIERHGSTLESIVEKVYELKLRVKELRLENDNSLEDIRS